jgi:hypothetical protein
MTLLQQCLYKAEQDLGSAKHLLGGNFYGTATTKISIKRYGTNKFIWRCLQ